MAKIERQKKPGEAWNTVEADQGGGQSMYVQDSDPGAVGAGKQWLDTSLVNTLGLSLLKIRNSLDTGWEGVTPAVYDPGPPETLASLLLIPGYVILVAQDLTNNVQSSLTVGLIAQNEFFPAPGVGLSLGIGTGLLSFYGVPPVTQPVVPQTTPDAQDVIDALVLLGLVAQHD